MIKIKVKRTHEEIMTNWFKIYNKTWAKVISYNSEFKCPYKVNKIFYTKEDFNNFEMTEIPPEGE